MKSTGPGRINDPIENLYFNSRTVNSPRSGSHRREVRTPRPTPTFISNHQTFSTKKSRGGLSTPRDCLPPKPPVKSAPPVSRIFAQRQIFKAQPVSFHGAEESFHSCHYDEDSQILYFDQCFEIIERIGYGSFGEVFKVRSREDGQFYAIKRSRDRFRGESDRKRKLEEVDKHERLPKHPNCVGFVKAWEEKQHLYIQTELCKASLSQVAEENHNIPEHIIWNYLVDLLMAVKHLHEHDLIHMDIKPDNIFVTEDGRCKLGDFGLVLDISKGLDYSEAQEGDPRYLAPELMQGKFAKSADVFSLGMSVLELATDLDLPRGGDLWHELRSGKLPDSFLLGVSSDLKQVVRCLLEPDPYKRLTVAQLLSSTLIRRRWAHRRRAQAVRTFFQDVRAMFYSFYMILVTFWITMTYPIKGFLPDQYRTPSKTPDTTGHRDMWDQSFSDDEFEGGPSISIHNNSMGVPLDCSTSSEESPRDPEGFVIPSPLNMPIRRAVTTPGQRLRSFRPPLFSPSTDAASPAFTRTHSTIFSSSPVNSMANSSFLNRSLRLNEITPDSSFSDKSVSSSDEALPSTCVPTPVKLGIEPKNLLGAFEGASDEEDD